ncbi:MAG: hypothetical protein Q9168_008028, partial [Polycauliona sp. 1 TL-2023]
MVYEIDPSIQTLESLRSDPAAAKAADLEYETTRTGIRTTIPSSVAYLPFSHYLSASHLSKLGVSISPSPENPRLAIQARRLTHDQNLGQIEFNFDLSNYSAIYPSQPGKRYATMLQMLQYPFSKGSIHIPPSTTARNGKRITVEDKPVIDPQYYAGEGGAIDLEMMAEAQRFACKIVETEPLSSIIVGRVWPPPPPPPSTSTPPSSSPNTTQAHTNEDLTPWVRNNTTTDWHPIGTCAMGPSIEAGYVVDDRLRVHGVKGLR